MDLSSIQISEVMLDIEEKEENLLTSNYALIGCQSVNTN